MPLKRRRAVVLDPLILCAAVLGMAFSKAGTGATFPCAGVPVEVSAPNAFEAGQACDVATGAIQFMRSHGFTTENPLRVRIVEHLPSRPYAIDLGQFDARTAQIKVLSYEHCREITRKQAPFQLSMSPALHKSFITHELAHAIAHENFSIPKPSREAHEYIAYTVQLASMDSALREEILALYPVDAFGDESEITSMYLGLNPAAFAVKSYKHLMSLPDPTSFYRRLLNGGFVSADVWE